MQMANYLLRMLRTEYIAIAGLDIATENLRLKEQALKAHTHLTVTLVRVRPLFSGGQNSMNVVQRMHNQWLYVLACSLVDMPDILHNDWPLLYSRLFPTLWLTNKWCRLLHGSIHICATVKRSRLWFRQSSLGNGLPFSWTQEQRLLHLPFKPSSLLSFRILNLSVKLKRKSIVSSAETICLSWMTLSAYHTSKRW